MEDVSQLLKRHFNLLHKGTNVAQTIDHRKEMHNNARKEKRDTLALLRRNIVGALSPIDTPTPRKTIKKEKVKVDTTREVPEKNQSFVNTGSSKRLELLQKWKAEKTKRKEQEKAKAKPIFKVCHITTTLTSDIGNANKFVKGKPVVPNSASKKSQFAPENHQFRPPSGIRPINFNTSVTKNSNKNVSKANTSISKKATPLLRTNISVSKKATPLLKTKIDLRSRKTKAETPSSSKLDNLGKTPNQENNARKPTTNTSKSTRDGPSTSTKKTTELKPLKSTRSNTKEIEKPSTSKNTTDKTPMNNITRRNKGNITGNTSNKTELNGTGTSRKTPQSVKVTVKENKVVEKKKNPRILNKNHKSIDIGLNDMTDSNKQVQSRKSSSSSSTNFVNDKELDVSSGNKIVDNEISSMKTPPISSLALLSENQNSTKNKSSNKTRISSANSSVDSKQKLKENLIDLTSPVIKTHLKSVLPSKNSSSSTDYSVDYNNFTSPEVSVFKTPPPVYISPFVTISRGKQSARKEYKIRSSQGKCEIADDPSIDISKIITNHTSPQAGAAYFKHKLDAEVERIERMCDSWNALLLDPTLPEEARPSISVTIGQSKLLVTKKFEQFRGLIRQCETKNYDLKPITCADLHGFWDMVNIQIEDLDKRFEELRKLRDNNWEEMLDEKRVVAKVTRTRGRPKKVQTKSKIKQMIEEARRKQKEQESSVSTEGTTTPAKDRLPLEVPNSSSRKNLRESIISMERKSRCSSSPGLTMMRVSQAIKRGDGLTPARSILKMDAAKSTGKKSVVFKEDLETSKVLSKVKLFSEEEKENQTDNLLVKDERVLTPRRSSRLTKHKI